MSRCLRHLLAIVIVGGLVSSCGYVVTVSSVEDEVVVKLAAGATPSYDHPLRVSSHDLAAVLQAVQVKFKTNWLQRLLSGPLNSLPLFDESSLNRVAPLLAEALERAGPRERVVFYVAQRKSDVRRDVTSGTIFVKGRLLYLTVTNYQNRVDVLPGVPAYDRQNPEVAIAPQRMTLVFDRPEFLTDREPDLVDGVFGAAPPRLMIDYALFLKTSAHDGAVSRSNTK